LNYDFLPFLVRKMARIILTIDSKWVDVLLAILELMKTAMKASGAEEASRFEVKVEYGKERRAGKED